MMLPVMGEFELFSSKESWDTNTFPTVIKIGVVDEPLPQSDPTTTILCNDDSPRVSVSQSEPAANDDRRRSGQDTTSSQGLQL